MTLCFVCFIFLLIDEFNMFYGMTGILYFFDLLHIELNTCRTCPPLWTNKSDHNPNSWQLSHSCSNKSLYYAVSLAQSTSNITKANVVTPHLPKYNPDGFVVFNEKGEVGKLCTENLNDTVLANRSAEILHTVASSLCQSLTYRFVFKWKISNY